mmetsp:Transcript_2579/g.8659  ORF Transcript_2579/g.8659 Transcript_2579/m.8659 type:complete len:280 (-) Transcript_2579:2853-3692(-)
MDSPGPVLLRRFVRLEHRRVVRGDLVRRVQVLQNFVGLVLRVQLLLLSEFDVHRRPPFVVAFLPLPKVLPGVHLAAELELVPNLLRLALQQTRRRPHQAVNLASAFAASEGELELEAGPSLQGVDDVLPREGFEGGSWNGVAAEVRRDGVRPETREPFVSEQADASVLGVFVAGNGLEPALLDVLPADTVLGFAVVVLGRHADVLGPIENYQVVVQLRQRLRALGVVADVANLLPVPRKPVRLRSRPRGLQRRRQRHLKVKDQKQQRTGGLKKKPSAVS